MQLLEIEMDSKPFHVHAQEFLGEFLEQIQTAKNGVEDDLWRRRYRDSWVSQFRGATSIMIGSSLPGKHGEIRELVEKIDAELVIRSHNLLDFIDRERQRAVAKKEEQQASAT